MSVDQLPAVKKLIAEYNLLSHPACEGWFAEQYRADLKVTGPQGARDAISSIYFLHRGDKKQAWRYLHSDEIFTYCTGSAIRVIVIDPATQVVKEAIVGPTLNGGRTEYQSFIPAKRYFTAEVVDETSYCLTGCIVAPGWVMEDYVHVTYEDMKTQLPNVDEKVYERFYGK